MPALDRFARFFVAPLFNAEYVDRERHAVESEYRLKIKDDARREWDVLRELANPRHPFSLFSVGNLDTLSDREGDAVRADLVDFYQRHYSANQMNLVVLGEQSLDELQQSVEARFADVPNRDLVLEEEEIPLFDRPMPFKVSVVPEKDMRQFYDDVCEADLGRRDRHERRKGPTPVRRHSCSRSLSRLMQVKVV